VALPAFAAVRLAAARLLLTAGRAAIDRYLLPAGLTAANPPLRYDTRCYFNVRSKADISQLNLPHGTDN